MPNTGFYRLAAAALLCWALDAGAQQVTLERDTLLQSEPRLDSSVVAQVKQGVTGEVTARNGAWVQVRTSAATGWVFSFNVRYPATAAGDGGAGTAGALGRLVGPRQNVNVTSSIGIRGLDEEDLRQARFDAAELKRLDDYAASKPEGEAAARRAGLSAARIEYFDGESR
jgi:hypothetical protein